MTNNVTITRIFDAPREVVWRAWTDQEQLARWWGPEGFTNPVCTFDPHPGSRIEIHMAGPDGTVYPMTGEVLEVMEPERLVFADRAFEDEHGNAGLEGRTTVTFVDLGGKTELTVHSAIIHASPDVSAAVEGHQEGWSGGLDKLERMLTDDARA